MQETSTMPDAHSGAAHRRGKHLPPIQTSFSNRVSTARLQRPRPVDTVLYEKSQVPLYSEPDPPQLKRRISRSSLLGLFVRTRSAKEVRDITKLQTTREDDSATFDVIPKVTSPTTKHTPTTPSKETRFVPTPSVQSPADLQFYGADIEPKTKPMKKKERSPRSSKTWDPPPLFQAYPQAVKHGNLSTPAASADTILRMDKQRQGQDSQQDKPQNISNLGTVQSTGGNDQNKPDPGKRPKHRKSEAISQMEWTNKIYVLATAGYLLQYAGEGSFDRLPEKIMQLGKDSAAFACDAIPGKHWVLQISQTSAEDGPLLGSRSRSVFSRLGFRGDSRRCVSTLLLVLNSAEDMNSWLVAVRKEIEALGGKRYRPDMTVRKNTDEIVQQIRQKPSRRYLVRRDPNQITSPSSTQWGQPDSLSRHPTDTDPPTLHASGTSSSTSSHRLSHAPSTTHTSISTDQILLDALREDPRSSYASTGAKTSTTSIGNSPLPSPLTSSFTHHSPPKSGSTTPTGPILDPSHRRRSLQTLSPSPLAPDFRPKPKPPRPLSTNSPTSPTSKPNFSVPTFSKRYSQPYKSPSPPTPAPAALATSSRNPPPSQHHHTRPDSIIGDLPITSMAVRPHTSTDAHPRRFSSLEYARPLTLPQARPPPTGKLPAVPGKGLRRPASMLVRSEGIRG